MTARADGAGPVPGKRLLVVFDQGAGGPLEIVNGVRPHAEPVFALAPTPSALAAGPVLRALGVDVVELPAGDPAGVLGLLAAPVDGVVTYSERMVRAAASLAEALGTPGHSVETARLLTDKALQRQRLRDAGVDDVPVAVVESAAALDGALDTVGLPAIVKPATGEGSRATHVIRRRDEAAAVFAAASRELAASAGVRGPLVVERLLVGADSAPYGDYVAAEVVAAGGRIDVVAVVGKFPQSYPFREYGSFRPSHLDPAAEDAVARLAADGARALGVTDGILHVEVKLTTDGPHVIEINGRIGGFTNDMTMRATGVDLVGVGALVALGERGTVPPFRGPQVLFQWYNNPPLGARRLLSVAGVSQLRKCAGVDSYATFVPPRSPLRDDVSTQLLDLLCGRAPSHAEMFDTLDEMLGTLTFSFEMAGGERLTLTGTELRDRNYRRGDLPSATTIGADT